MVLIIYLFIYYFLHIFFKVLIQFKIFFRCDMDCQFSSLTNSNMIRKDPIFKNLMLSRKGNFCQTCQKGRPINSLDKKPLFNILFAVFNYKLYLLYNSYRDHWKTPWWCKWSVALCRGRSQLSSQTNWSARSKCT